MWEPRLGHEAGVSREPSHSNRSQRCHEPPFLGGSVSDRSGWQTLRGARGRVNHAARGRASGEVIRPRSPQAQGSVALVPRGQAFLDADAMVKWLPPNGFTGKVHQMDVKVGGTYRMSFTNFTTGHTHSFGGEYLELVPHERVRHTDKFDDPNLPGEMQTEDNLEGSFLRNRAGDRARGRVGSPTRGLLSRLAGVACALDEAGRGGDSRTRASGRLRPARAGVLLPPRALPAR